jgi:hypothetical protein
MTDESSDGIYTTTLGKFLAKLSKLHSKLGR